MTTRRTYILAWLLLASLFCQADATSGNPLTPAEYRAQLDSLLVATQQLSSSNNAAPESLRHLPQNWRVRAGQQDFEISTEGLQRDVRRYDQVQSVEHAIAIRRRLESLGRDIDGFEKPPADVTASRTQLNSILAQPEFAGHGPKWKWFDWFDKKLRELRNALGDWLGNVIESIFRILGRLFGWTSIPTVGKVVVYGLSGVALAALLYFVYRNIFRAQETDEVVPKNLPVSAKEWSIWLGEARAAAARGEWRDAIHLAYWAGISFLERRGFWKPDRARTPREYLRLLSGESEHRQTLVALTRIFELAWYAKRDASEQTFSQALEQLEKLGCR